MVNLTEVTLAQMLMARDERAEKQHRLLEKYKMPLVCFTMNIAGPIKNSDLIYDGFLIGKKKLDKYFTANKIKIIYFEETNSTTGNEAFFVADANLSMLKKIAVEIEDDGEIGRLFDIDVIECVDEAGKVVGKKIDRTEIGKAGRNCLICGKPAKECARSRAHSVQELQEKTNEILHNAVSLEKIKTTARLAEKALLYEVCTTPKPGLVDCVNNGSHSDMDVFLFVESATAIADYLAECVKIGAETATLPAADVFPLLRAAGKKADAAMLYATNGVNTHKGAVFSMGIACGALGRVMLAQWSDVNAVCGVCAEIAKSIVKKDFADVTEKNAQTEGQKLYVRNKITGVRGEVEAGFPSVRNFSLPILKKCLSKGLSLNDAACVALLYLIANTVDTNMIARSDVDSAKKISQEIQSLLQKNPFPVKDEIYELDKMFIQKNLSPGGSADLLAITYLLYFVEKEFGEMKNFLVQNFNGEIVYV